MLGSGEDPLNHFACEVLAGQLFAQVVPRLSALSAFCKTAVNALIVIFFYVTHILFVEREYSKCWVEGALPTSTGSLLQTCAWLVLTPGQS